jgi:NitT/TauT family transport system ATP-binding protein
MSSILTVKNISKRYNDGLKPLTVLEDVSFDVHAGEFICLIGPSGCGKSTLLRIMAGLDHANRGNITMGQNVTTAMVFQNFALFPWLTVGENIAFGLTMQKREPHYIRKQVETYAAVMGLTDFVDQHPKELSGGMKQRVGIARALAVEPAILFMDEPFSALDALTAKTLRHDLLGIWEKQKMTVVMVTHLVEEAVQLADQIIVFSPRPGHVKEIKTVPLSRPRQVRTKPYYDEVDALSALLTHA